MVEHEALNAIKVASKISENTNFDSIVAKTKLKNPLSGKITAKKISDMEMFTTDKIK